MNRLKDPGVFAENMAVVPTARMQKLRAQINEIQARTNLEIEALEKEFARLTRLEQHKVLAAYVRNIQNDMIERFVPSEDEILYMAEEIKTRRESSFANNALAAAYADCHPKKTTKHGR